MIPKIIHYCWFGRNPLPEMAKKCISSWKKYLPDYEIKEWNEDNFDVNIIPYTAEAYRAKKYAFVSDYARFWILYKYGGLYFDTDVEVIKSMDEIIARGPFMGCENKAEKGATTLGVAPGLGLYEMLVKSYEGESFINKDGSYNQITIVKRTTQLLCELGLKNTDEIQCVAGVNIYPVDYFCPMNRFNHKIEITPNTVSIHHYDASWQTPETKWIQKTTYKYSWIPNVAYVVNFMGALKFRGFSAATKDLVLWVKTKYKKI